MNPTPLQQKLAELIKREFTDYEIDKMYAECGEGYLTQVLELPIFGDNQEDEDIPQTFYTHQVTDIG